MCDSDGCSVFVIITPLSQLNFKRIKEIAHKYGRNAFVKNNAEALSAAPEPVLARREQDSVTTDILGGCGDKATPAGCKRGFQAQRRTAVLKRKMFMLQMKLNSRQKDMLMCAKQRTTQ